MPGFLSIHLCPHSTHPILTYSSFQGPMRSKSNPISLACDWLQNTGLSQSTLGILLVPWLGPGLDNVTYSGPMGLKPKFSRGFWKRGFLTLWRHIRSLSLSFGCCYMQWRARTDSTHLAFSLRINHKHRGGQGPA